MKKNRPLNVRSKSFICKKFLKENVFIYFSFVLTITLAKESQKKIEIFEGDIFGRHVNTLLLEKIFFRGGGLTNLFIHFCILKHENCQKNIDEILLYYYLNYINFRIVRRLLSYIRLHLIILKFFTKLLEMIANIF